MKDKIKVGSDFSGVVCYNIPELVFKSKFLVDIAGLQKCLKKHKKTTIKNIAENLNVPKTEVEHWFRTDKFFAIPRADIWLKLKKFLNINTSKFDAPVMEFIEQDGIYDQANRVYDVNGGAPTITSTSADIRLIL